MDRHYDETRIIRFLRFKWRGLIIATASWIVIYNLFLRFYMNQHMNIGQVLKGILFVQPVILPHIWYMPMIIGVYAFLPFMANALHLLKKIKVLYVPIFIISLYAFIVPMINEICRVLGKGILANGIDFGFSGGVYGIYIIIGFLLKREAFQRIQVRYLVIGCLLTFILTIVLQTWAFYYGKVLDPWYNWGTILLYSLCIFEFISRIHTTLWSQHWISIVAKYSFAMYLTHYPLLMILKPVLQKLCPLFPINVVILWCWGVIGSLIVSICIAKIPYIGRKIIYIR